MDETKVKNNGKIDTKINLMKNNLWHKKLSRNENSLSWLYRPRIFIASPYNHHQKK